MKTKVNKITETAVNKTEDYIIGESSLPIEDSTITNLQELYEHGLSEYGRCTSKIFVDGPFFRSPRKHIGYTFEKRVKYTDSEDTYLQEMWLAIEHYTETVTREYL